MADVLTQFSTLSTDAPNVWIASQQYPLLENRLVVGSFAKKYSLPQRMSKTMRITRHKRISLPTAPLTEGVPPDAVALAVENVDVTVEQWGIVVFLTDVSMITTDHPALNIAIDRVSLAMSEVLEREQCQMLMAGTQVYYAGATAGRANIGATDYISTAVALKTTAALRTLGSNEWDGSLFGCVMHPNVEADLAGNDTTFIAAANYANVRRLEYAEAGIWMGLRVKRGNFLPVFQGTPAPDASAATAEKAQVTAVDGGGTITSATNFKFVVVARDLSNNYERKISQTSANIASTATGNNESFSIALPTSANYVYDVYMTAAGGAGALFKVKSNVTGTTVITTMPLGTEATSPAAPADQRNAFVTWVFGAEAFGRVELNGMSLASYLTPPGASHSNPLAQGRKVGSKIMWKSFIIDNNFFARIETTSRYSPLLPA
jgi:N4-gp56 family major capsid protein